MNKVNITVLRTKTAKMIMDACYVADKSASYLANLGAIDVTGSTINATARHIKDKNEWVIGIESAVLEPSTLQSIIDGVFAALNAHKSAK